MITQNAEFAIELPDDIDIEELEDFLVEYAHEQDLFISEDHDTEFEVDLFVFDTEYDGTRELHKVRATFIEHDDDDEELILTVVDSFDDEGGSGDEQ